MKKLLVAICIAIILGTSLFLGCVEEEHRCAPSQYTYEPIIVPWDKQCPDNCQWDREHSDKYRKLCICKVCQN